MGNAGQDRTGQGRPGKGRVRKSRSEQVREEEIPVMVVQSEKGRAGLISEGCYTW